MAAAAAPLPYSYIDEPERCFHNGTLIINTPQETNDDKTFYQRIVSKINTHRISIRGCFRYINGCYMEDDGTFGDDPMDAANDVLRNHHSRHADARLIIMALTHRNPSRDVGTAAAAIIYDAWLARGNQTDVVVWDELCKRCGA